MSQLDLYWEFIRYCIDKEQSVPQSIKEIDWNGFFDFCLRQAVLGVGFYGIQRMGNEQSSLPPKELLLKWFVTAQRIRKQNELLNIRAVQVSEKFKHEGFRSCILKGQGNARMYPNQFARNSGDIDIWIDGTREAIRDFVKKECPDAEDGDLHIHYPIFEDAEVEVHYKPRYMNTPKYEKCLQEFFRSEAEKQFSNTQELPGGAGKVNVSTVNFNLVYQVSHMMGHFFDEGIGLRHFIDYYYVLRSNRRADLFLEDMFRRTGMLKFARGLMWVEHEVLGIEGSFLVAEQDAIMGKILLTEMLHGGNFGKYDNRYSFRQKGYLARGITDVFRLMQLTAIFPEESLWKILVKLPNQRWKIINLLNKKRAQTK